MGWVLVTLNSRRPGDMCVLYKGWGSEVSIWESSWDEDGGGAEPRAAADNKEAAGGWAGQRWEGWSGEKERGSGAGS